MAGGKITRIVGGSNTIECEAWIVYTDKFTAYAQNGSHFTADKGTNIGDPKEAPTGRYFKKGWWADKDGKKITNAKIGDTVYFHVEMTDKFPKAKLQTDKQKVINFNLFKFDGNYYSVEDVYFIRAPFAPPIPVYVDIEKKPKKNKEQEIHYVTWIDKDNDGIIDVDEEKNKIPYTKIEAKGNKAVINFRIEEGLSDYFNEFDELKLFMSVAYDDETLILPEDETEFLDIEPLPEVVKEIYVRLLNYDVSKIAISKLNGVGGHIQYIQGNDEFMSDKVNMDYFSVRIDELPKFANGNIMTLYKKIRENFLTLSKGNTTFKTHSANQIDVNGRWEFKTYPKEDNPEFSKEQLKIWNKDLGSAIFLIAAGGGFVENRIGDHGAVLESESDPYEMCWIFTTIYTKESETQPFSGHRQFGIHKDEDGNYRFFARAIDRVWPSEIILKITENKDRAVKDYLTIADATWNNLIRNVSQFINNNGGKTTIMKPEIVRTNFNKFLSKYKTQPTLKIGNIPQYKEISENEL